MNDGQNRNDRAGDGPGDASAGDRPPSPDVLGLDHVYRALAHPRRRYLCYTLLGGASWSLSDLATRIAAWENGASEDAVTECQRQRVIVSLYHAHVPKLVDDDIVAFDEASETIRPAGNATQVLSVLEAIEGSVDGRQEAHARDETDDVRR